MENFILALINQWPSGVAALLLAYIAWKVRGFSDRLDNAEIDIVEIKADREKLVKKNEDQHSKFFDLFRDLKDEIHEGFANIRESIGNLKGKAGMNGA